MKKEDMRKLFLSKVEEMVTAYNEGGCTTIAKML